jgi:hypothetical protein
MHVSHPCVAARTAPLRPGFRGASLVGRRCGVRRRLAHRIRARARGGRGASSLLPLVRIPELPQLFAGGHQLDGDAVGISELQRWAAILHDDSVMEDALSSQVGGPGTERGSVRDGERNVVQTVARRRRRTATGPRAFREHHDDVGVGLEQRDVTSVDVVRVRDQAEDGAIPVSARVDVGDEELNMGQADDRSGRRRLICRYHTRSVP